MTLQPELPLSYYRFGRKARKIYPRARLETISSLLDLGLSLIHILTGIINLPEGVEMCMPGDNVVMSVELITPIAIEKGLRFAIREGGRTVGSGVVTEID